MSAVFFSSLPLNRNSWMLKLKINWSHLIWLAFIVLFRQIKLKMRLPMASGQSKESWSASHDWLHIQFIRRKIKEKGKKNPPISHSVSFFGLFIIMNRIIFTYDFNVHSLPFGRPPSPNNLIQANMTLQIKCRIGFFISFSLQFLCFIRFHSFSFSFQLFHFWYFIVSFVFFSFFFSH